MRTEKLFVEFCTFLCRLPDLRLRYVLQGCEVCMRPTGITPLEESYFGVFEAQSGHLPGGISQTKKPRKKVSVPDRIQTGRIQHTRYSYVKFYAA
jgi:hypothetical protein